MNSGSDSDDTTDVAELERRIAELEAQVDEGGGNELSTTRRDTLALFGSGIAGMTGDVGLPGIGQSDRASAALLEEYVENVYRIAGDLYGGPASARTNLNSELESGDEGSRFAADDTGDRYYWSGSDWDSLPVSTHRIPDVVRFVDPSMSAADVQEEIDELADNGGGTVFWKRGTHRYGQNSTVGGEAAAIELRSNIRYTGVGYGSHLVQDEKDINLFATEYDSNFTDQETAGDVERIEIDHLRLDGNKGTFSNFSERQVNNVLWLPLAREVHCHDLFVEEVHQHGIHPDAVVDSTFRDCLIQNVDGHILHAATRTGDSSMDEPTVGPLRCRFENITGKNADRGLNTPSAEDVLVTGCLMKNINAGAYGGHGDRLTYKYNDCVGASRAYNFISEWVDYSRGIRERSTDITIVGGHLDVDTTIKSMYFSEVDDLSVKGRPVVDAADDTGSAYVVHLDDVRRADVDVEVHDAHSQCVRVESNCEAVEVRARGLNPGDEVIDNRASGTVVHSVEGRNGSGKMVNSFASIAIMNAVGVDMDGRGIRLGGADSSVSNARLINCAKGIQVDGARTTLNNVHCRQCGTEGVKIDAPEVTLVNAELHDNNTRNSPNDDLEVKPDGSNTHLVAVHTDSFTDEGTDTTRNGVTVG